MRLDRRLDRGVDIPAGVDERGSGWSGGLTGEGEERLRDADVLGDRGID